MTCNLLPSPHLPPRQFATHRRRQAAARFLVAAAAVVTSAWAPTKTHRADRDALQYYDARWHIHTRSLARLFVGPFYHLLPASRRDPPENGTAAPRLTAGGCTRRGAKQYTSGTRSMTRHGASALPRERRRARHRATNSLHRQRRLATPPAHSGMVGEIRACGIAQQPPYALALAPCPHQQRGGSASVTWLYHHLCLSVPALLSTPIYSTLPASPTPAEPHHLLSFIAMQRAHGRTICIAARISAGYSGVY